MTTRRSFLGRFLAALVISFLGMATLPAQDAAERIRDRLPEVDALKSAGLVGENNRGLLEARMELTSAQEAIVEAENSDRNELYALVAGRRGESREAIGQQRAVRIARQALAGVWLQSADGEWYKKR